MKAREKELRDWCENGSEDREPKCSHYPVKSAARSMSTREQRLAKQRMVVSRNNHILAFGEVFESRSFPSNSLNVCFGVFLTLHYTWPCAMPTNSNVHVSPVGSKIIEMRVRGIHCEYIHLVIYDIMDHTYKHYNQETVYEIAYLSCTSLLVQPMEENELSCHAVSSGA